MACHILPLKKAKKQGEMPLPSLSPIPLKKFRERKAVAMEMVVKDNHPEQQPSLHCMGSAEYHFIQ